MNSFRGYVKDILEKESYQGKPDMAPLITQIVVVEMEGERPQMIPIKVMGEKKIDQIRDLTLGMRVEVEFYLRGFNWADKVTGKRQYRSEIVAYRISPVQNLAGKTIAREVEDEVPF